MHTFNTLNTAKVVDHNPIIRRENSCIYHLLSILLMNGFLNSQLVHHVNRSVYSQCYTLGWMVIIKGLKMHQQFSVDVFTSVKTGARMCAKYFDDVRVDIWVSMET